MYINTRFNIGDVVMFELGSMPMKVDRIIIYSPDHIEYACLFLAENGEIATGYFRENDIQYYSEKKLGF